MPKEKTLHMTSITKKLLVALAGTFLLVFVLFHACANLMILIPDGGDAYGAFCHFMSSKFVKIIEIGLFAIFAVHIILTAWLWFSNRANRPVRYHHRSKTRTAAGSKLAIISGSLLLVLLVFHFYDFFFVKMNWVKGAFMVKTEQLNDERFSSTVQMLNMYQTSPEEILDMYAKAEAEGQKLTDDDRYTINVLKTVQLIQSSSDKFSKDGMWLRQISVDQRDQLQQLFPDAEFEPDFYHIARQKFSVWHIVLCYLIFFAVVGLHLRHGFESAFQTFGLNHYKYSRLIFILGIIYVWMVCLAFSVVPLGVFFGL